MRQYEPIDEWMTWVTILHCLEISRECDCKRWGSNQNGHGPHSSLSPMHSAVSLIGISQVISFLETLAFREDMQ